VPAILVDPFLKEPYSNPNYIVTEECVHEVARAIVLDSGQNIISSERDLEHFRSLMTNLIHSSTKNSLEVGIENEIFYYIFSASGNNLELVLFKLDDSSELVNVYNTMGGLKSHTLNNCKINP